MKELAAEVGALGLRIQSIIQAFSMQSHRLTNVVDEHGVQLNVHDFPPEQKRSDYQYMAAASSSDLKWTMAFTQRSHS